MNNTATLADRQTLLGYIATLDFQIQKLSKIFNSSLIDTGSLMIQGRNNVKEYNELIVWNKNHPLPRQLMREFMQILAQDLINKREQLIRLANQEIFEFEEETRQHNCGYCCRSTLQKNYSFLPGSHEIAIPAPAGDWICTVCETTNKQNS